MIKNLVPYMLFDVSWRHFLIETDHNRPEKDMYVCLRHVVATHTTTFKWPRSSCSPRLLSIFKLSPDLYAKKDQQSLEPMVSFHLMCGTFHNNGHILTLGNARRFIYNILTCSRQRIHEDNRRRDTSGRPIIVKEENVQINVSSSK